MIRTVLFLRPRENDGRALARFYQQELVLERALAMPGCISAEIALPDDGKDPVMVTAVWESPAAYQGWVDDPWRQHVAADIGPYLSEELPGTASGLIYEVVHAVSTAPRGS